MLTFSHLLSDTHAIVLTAVLIAAFIYLCIYYGLFHFRVGRYGLKKPSVKTTGSLSNDDTPPVSVVLTARNDEAENTLANDKAIVPQTVKTQPEGNVLNVKMPKRSFVVVKVQP